MRLIKAVVAISLVAGAMAAWAGPTLNFDDLIKPNADGEYLPIQVKEAYAALGVGFGDGAWAYASASADPANGGNFINTPSGNTAIGLPDASTSFVINLSKGFGTSLLLQYTTNQSALQIDIYSALNGQGQLLGSSGALAVPQPDACGGLLMCEWDTADVRFSGEAFSVRISGTPFAVFLDNLSFGDLAVDPPVDVPEPASLALALAGFGAAALSTRRRKRG
jgi:PEP-CTERM motif